MVARRIDGPVKLRPRFPDHSADIMAGGKAIRAQVLRQRKQVGELHPHVTANTRDRRAPRDIIIGKAVDHRIAKAALVVKDIMCDAKLVGDGARIADVLPRTTGTRALGGLAMIIKLKRYADHFGTRPRGKGSDDRRINAARHRDNNTRLGDRSIQLKKIVHDAHLMRRSTIRHGLRRLQPL